MQRPPVPRRLRPPVAAVATMRHILRRRRAVAACAGSLQRCPWRPRVPLCRAADLQPPPVPRRLRRLCVGTLARVLRHLWQRHTVSLATDQNQRRARWEGLSTAYPDAALHRWIMPGTLSGVAIQRVEPVHQDLWHRQSEAKPEGCETCTARWVCVPVPSGGTRLWQARMPSGLCCGAVWRMVSVHTFVWYWLPAAYSAHPHQRRSWW